LSTAAGAGVTAPVTSNYSMTLHWGVGGNQLTMTGMRKLPASAAALSRVLLRMWKGEPDKAGAVGFPDPTYTQYLMAWAEQLLTGPAQPGTKAAIFRLLAGQPGINLVKGVTDPLNRTAVAVGDGGGDYLVMTPARLSRSPTSLTPSRKTPLSAGAESRCTSPLAGPAS
jgi:hypothetical protein